MTDDAVTDSAGTPPGRRGQHLKANRDRSYDVALGARIRAFRVAARMTQTDLGQTAGISFQQVQKYETGRDRVSASTLFGFAVALNIPPRSLFGGEPPHVPPRSVAGDGLSAKIIVLFQEIRDPGIQKRLVELAKVLSEGFGVKLRMICKDRPN